MNMNLTTPAAGDPVAPRRKPRIMVAGEFSAGKSRLINALVGKVILPSNVTSTALPPMWLTGPGVASTIVWRDGSVSGYDADRIEEIDIEQTAFCILSVDAPILRHVDLIDTPGNSDPNIPSECWERMLPYADGLVWCSSAMQAWKQSEKANCALMPEELRRQSLLVVTQADRMPDAKSAEKVLRRVRREALPVLNDVVMASALDEEDVATVKALILELAASLPLRGQAETLVDAAPVADTPVAPEPVGAIGVGTAPEAADTEVAETMPDLLADLAPDVPEPVQADAAGGHAPVAPADVALASSEDPVTPSSVPPLDRQDGQDAAPGTGSSEDVGGTSLLLPDGTVHRLWTEIVADADLSDNERFLTCVSVLLSETRILLRAGTS